MAGYDIDVAALSETGAASEDQLTRPDSKYTIFRSGKAEKKREAGVDFAGRISLLDKIERPVVLSGCNMTMRILLAGGRFLISVYAPNLRASEEASTSFYQALRKVVTAIQQTRVVVLGDFNARLDNNL